MWYTWWRREIHTGFWWGNKESNLLADLDIGWEVNITTRQASTYNKIMCSCKNCCSGKAIRITYSECVFVDSGIQHAMCLGIYCR
jgi:hypothetical protein